jgi:hypothetical protein
MRAGLTSGRPSAASGKTRVPIANDQIEMAASVVDRPEIATALMGIDPEGTGLAMISRGANDQDGIAMAQTAHHADLRMGTDLALTGLEETGMTATVVGRQETVAIDREATALGMINREAIVHAETETIAVKDVDPRVTDALMMANSVRAAFLDRPTARVEIDPETIDQAMISLVVIAHVTTNHRVVLKMATAPDATGTAANVEAHQETVVTDPEATGQEMIVHRAATKETMTASEISVMDRGLIDPTDPEATDHAATGMMTARASRVSIEMRAISD